MANGFKVASDLLFSVLCFITCTRQLDWPLETLATWNQGCGSAIRVRDCSTKKKLKYLLSPGHVSARRSLRYIIRPNTIFFASPITRNAGPPSTLLIWIWILAFCLCNTLFFMLFRVEPILPLTLVVALRSCLPGIARYLLGDCLKNSKSLFSIFRLP